MSIFKEGTRVAKNTAAPIKETSEIEESVQKSEETVSKPKKKRKAKRVIVLFGGVVLIASIVASTIAYKAGLFDNFIKKYLSNDDDTNKDEITAVADLLPIDNNGIIDITTPWYDRTLDEDNGRYTFTYGYVPYDIYNSENGTHLEAYQGNGEGSKNQVDYQTNNGLKPVGTIGILPEYKEFLTKIEDIKVKIATGDTTYTAPLKSVDYEVSDLYSIPDGYDLYTEDSEARDYAKLAYVDTNGSKVYMIPSMFVSKFIGVKTEIFELIAKYEGLKEQVIFAYNTYNNNAREVIEAIDEETTNRGR